jgi:hypothetical protein
MAYTSAEITEKELELSAVKTAYNESLASGSVTNFRQGTTEFTKASSADLKKLVDSTTNELYRMKH